MTDDMNKTNDSPPEFDFSTFPSNTLFHERRSGRERRGAASYPAGRNGNSAPRRTGPPERRARKERRKRIDPTTFEKQYTVDELEFMNAVQRFKERTGNQFPTHGEVIKVAVALGYRKLIDEPSPEGPDAEPDRLDPA
jgi:hypothetical protein